MTPTTPQGRQMILETPEMRKDIVLEGTNDLGHGFDFVYHCTNKSCKSYNLKEALLKKQRDDEYLSLHGPNDEPAPDFSANHSKD